MIRPQVVETLEAEAERLRESTRREMQMADRKRPSTPAEPAGPLWRARDAVAEIDGAHLSWLFGRRAA